MKKISKALLPTCTLLFFIFLFLGCDKEFSTIESDVIGEDNVNFNSESKNIAITAYNKKLDSVQISNLTSVLFGVYNDPAYGQTKASIVTQIAPTSYNPNFGVNAIIDSVVLTIPFFSRTFNNTTTGETEYPIDSLYGNAAAKTKITIYQNNYFLRSFNPNSGLNEPQRYFSNANNADKSVNSAVIENATINFDAHKGAIIKDTIFTPINKAIVLTTGTGDAKTAETIEPAFRVHLDKNFWTTTILDKQGDAVLSNASNFNNYFRGLYIKAEPSDTNDGSMALLNLADVDSNIIIYYTKDTSVSDNTKIQASYRLNFTGNKVNTFINNHNLVTLQNGNKTDGDQTLYLKNVGSMAVVDLFPDLNALEVLRADLKNGTNQDALINEAQLVIYENIIASQAGAHTYDRIYAYDIENNTPLVDYAFDQTTNVNNPINSKFIHLGQRLEEGEDSGVYKYKIRITEHLNRLIFNNSTNTKIGLVLSNNVNLTNNSLILNSGDGVTAIPAASVLSPRGTILHGSNSDNIDRRMALKLYYTKPK